MVFVSRLLHSAAGSAKRIDLFFDVVSPYTYVGFELMTRYTTHWKTPIHFRPAFLAGIVAGSGNNFNPMGLSEVKLKYTFTDLQRTANFYDVPLDPNNVVPAVSVGSLQPMRFVTATDMLFPEAVIDVARAFFRKRYDEGEDMTTEEAMRDVGAKANLSPEKVEQIFEKMKTKEAKERLKQVSQEAVDCGVFGLPSAVFHSDDKTKMFFGSDRFPYLAKEAKEVWKGPFPDTGTAI